jgi:hypothetical protein
MDGHILMGTGQGFTSDHVGTGHYRLTFDGPPWGGTPAVTATAWNSSNANVAISSIQVSGAHWEFNFSVTDPAGAPVDTSLMILFTWYG